MSLSSRQLTQLKPRLGNLGLPNEPPKAYAARVQKLLPNFPKQVITQWFRDHHQVIEEHRGLDYPTLQFKLVAFGDEELKMPCLAEHPTVVQYRNYFLQGMESQKMRRIAEHMTQHGTWPIAPLIFDNPDGRFVASWGLRYSRPYDLLEGHHRMAVLYALRKHEQGSHTVWLVQQDA